MIFRFFQIFVWLGSWFLGRVFLNFKSYGLENIKEQKLGGVIFAANHQGYFDPFLISVDIVPLKDFGKHKAWRYMTYYKYVYYSWFGFLIWLAGAYPVKSSQNLPIEKSTAFSIKLLKKGYDILVFPTGKLIKDFQPSDARRGIGYIAKETKATIIPCHISGTHKISLNDFLLRRRTVEVRVGKPLSYEEAAKNGDEPIQIAQEVMRKVKELELSR